MRFSIILSMFLVSLGCLGGVHNFKYYNSNGMGTYHSFTYIKCLKGDSWTSCSQSNTMVAVKKGTCYLNSSERSFQTDDSDKYRTIFNSTDNSFLIFKKRKASYGDQKERLFLSIQKNTLKGVRYKDEKKIVSIQGERLSKDIKMPCSKWNIVDMDEFTKVLEP